jgi:hypothetical protein
MKVVEIDRRHKLPYEDFAHEYLFPNKPVIVSGALEGWRAIAIWTPEYLKDKYRSINLRIDGKNYTMVDFIDRVSSSTPLGTCLMHDLCIVRLDVQFVSRGLAEDKIFTGRGY